MQPSCRRRRTAENQSIVSISVSCFLSFSQPNNTKTQHHTRTQQRNCPTLTRLCSDSDKAECTDLDPTLSLILIPVLADFFSSTLSHLGESVTEHRQSPTSSPPLSHTLASTSLSATPANPVGTSLPNLNTQVYLAKRTWWFSVEDWDRRLWPLGLVAVGDGVVRGFEGVSHRCA